MNNGMNLALVARSVALPARLSVIVIITLEKYLENILLMYIILLLFANSGNIFRCVVKVTELFYFYLMKLFFYVKFLSM